MVNIVGMISLAQKAVQHMPEGGSIINVSHLHRALFQPVHQQVAHFPHVCGHHGGREQLWCCLCIGDCALSQALSLFV